MIIPLRHRRRRPLMPLMPLMLMTKNSDVCRNTSKENLKGGDEGGPPPHVINVTNAINAVIRPSEIHITTNVQ